MNQIKWMPLDPPLAAHPNQDFIIYLSRRFLLDVRVTYWLYLHGYTNEELLEGLLFPSEKQFHNPFLFNDMKKAIDRIIKAIINKERIWIFGDYDADGITSTSILYRGLQEVQANVSFQLPLREEGYGITPEAIESISKYNVGLIITVDNGSSAYHAMKKAKEKGIDIIVTDHHDILGEYPNCFAFINPKRSDNTYPFIHLCGAGVAFKLLEALFTTLNHDWYKFRGPYLELAAIGTIADLVPLIGENRAICQLGLKRLNLHPQSVLHKLFNVLKLTSIGSSTIGFVLAPILNSVGRIGNPNIAVSLLCNPNPTEQELKELISYNAKRQAITNEQFQQAEKFIVQNELSKQSVVVVHGDFHKGIIGIIASRISERYQKPSIVISSCGTASCRGVNGTDFSMINTLKRCEKYFLKYGGHKAAAGFSINLNDIEEFSRAVQMSAVLEGEITSIKRFICQLPIVSVSPDLKKDLLALEPFGMSFPNPLFYSGRLKLKTAQIFGQQNEHLSFMLGHNKVIAFSKGRYINHILQKEMGFLYSIQRDSFLAEDIKYLD